MKQVHMKATELKIDVVRFIVNFPLIKDGLGLHLWHEINGFEEQICVLPKKIGRGSGGRSPPVT